MIRTVDPPTTEVHDSVFRIMSYNIGYMSGMTNNEPVRPERTLYESNLASGLRFLDAIDADIIAFQEIDYGSQRSYEIDQEKEIADKLHYPYVARAVNWDKKYVPFPYWPISVHFGKVLSGQSVLSKFPILQQSVDTLSKVASAPFYYNAYYLERLAQVCT